MSIVDVNKIESDIFPLSKGQELQSVHYNALRERMWVLEHPSAGNVDTTIAYGKWVGDNDHFLFVDYDINNWAGWNPEAEYHPGFPKVKYRWGSGIDQVDLFVFKGQAFGDVLSLNPPVVGGTLNRMWLLGIDPNKYSHWNYNAGRPDIGAVGRWIISQHGYEAPPSGVGWTYGFWKAYQELPTHTDPYKQRPYIKNEAGLCARHRPVEKTRADVSIKLQTQTRRMFHDGTIGTPPNETPWYDHYFPDTVSEYIRLNGDPIDSIQVGPDYREPKKNSAYQDRIQHLIEQNYWYVVEVNDFWKKSWQYWTHNGVDMDGDNDEGCVNSILDYVNGRGDWLPYEAPGYSRYDPGESVWHTTWLWCCIKETPASSIEPGVTEGWEDYWVKNILYQPDYVSATPLYVQFSDYLFHCNSSAFEKVLKDIGHCDWYWDKEAAVPWWMYQKHYYYMTMEMANPGVGHAVTAWKRWPLPRGCWRRVPRHTMNWDDNRNQKSRFGKEINIDGKMVSMMWPGELGDPPGYDEQLTWWGHVGGINYNYWRFQHVITQQLYDNMERPAGATDTYTQYYTVVDVEELFRQAYLSNSSAESRIAERHDPQATEWVSVYNETLGIWERKEIPIFEGPHHEMINDMRDALLKLEYLRTSKTKTTTHCYWSTQKKDYPDGISAYQAGKQSELYDEYSTSEHFNGYRALVTYYSEEWNEHSPYDPTMPGMRTARQTTRVKIASTQQDFPGSFVGAAMIRILYRNATAYSSSTPPPSDGCHVGFMDEVIHDDRPGVAGGLTWLAAYVGLEIKDFTPEYNGESGLWEFVFECQTVLLDDWPDEAYFGGTYADHEWRDWWRALAINWDIDNDCIFKLNFHGYNDIVFERDETNFIEV